MSLMELTGVYYAYPGEKEYILKDFSMRVEEGECLIITGDNGSGKTTLFRLLNGLIFAERGKYIYSGEEINEKFLKNNRRSKLFHFRRQIFLPAFNV